jgi:undecaprenyl-diphosphatase
MNFIHELLLQLYAVDCNVLLFINGHHCFSADLFMYMVSDKMVWLPLYLFLFLYIGYSFGWRRAITSLVLIVLCLVLTDQISSSFIRSAVCRMRPANPDNPLSAFIHTVNDYHGGSYGFPSSHAANTAGLTCFCVFVLRRRWLSWVMVGWMVLVCYSRMYLGVHYPSDILAGWLLGFLCMQLVRITYIRVRDLNMTTRNLLPAFSYSVE